MPLLRLQFLRLLPSSLPAPRVPSAAEELETQYWEGVDFVKTRFG